MLFSTVEGFENLEWRPEKLIEVHFDSCCILP